MTARIDRAAAYPDRATANGGRATAPIDRLWVAGAHADRVAVDEREAVARHYRSLATREELLVLHTCHRVEVVGSGGDPSVMLAEAPSASSMRHLSGSDAIRHVLRLATGLESAVVGEDQILGQLRVAFSTASRALPSDVRRLAEVALAAGREARAGDLARGRDLSRPALQWLVDQGVVFEGGRILIVGAGTLGMRLAHSANARGAKVLVASRDAGHAANVAQRYGGESLDLAEAAALAPHTDGIAVALGGPWRDLLPVAGLPPMVDLSAPPAVASEVRRQMGARFGDVDRLFPARSMADAGLPAPPTSPAPPGSPATPATERQSDDAYAARAEAVVDSWAARYERWLSGRGAVPTLCSLRDRSEERRRVAVERLLRRMPDLAEREQELIGTFSRQLTAALLHEPSARLREDEDGSAAQAARTLFDLPR